MRIIADTATLISPAQGAEMGLTIVPVCVAINGNTYKDYADISSEEYLRLIEAGGVLKLLPVLTQTEDKTCIKPVTVKRTWKTAVGVVLQQLQAAGVGAEHLISICHAGTPEHAETVSRQVKEAFPGTETEILQLSPALITHGGPGCIVIQSVLK